MAGLPAARRRTRPRTDAFTFILHWGVVAAVTLSLLTGLRIAADYDASVAGAVSAKLRWLLLEGPVIEWHIWSGWTLTFIAVSYAAFLWRARQVDRIKSTARSGCAFALPDNGVGSGRTCRPGSPPTC